MNPPKATPTSIPRQPVGGWLPPSLKVPLLAGALLLGGLCAGSAATVTLKANDGVGTSSFINAGQWSSGAAPAPGNTYFTTNTSGTGFFLRSPTGLSSNVFAGDGLVLCTNLTPGAVSLLIKGNQGSYVIVNNLVMAGGGVGNGGDGGSPTVNTTNTLGGFINMLADSRFDSGGAGRAILVAAAITNGTGTVICTNYGSIWLYADNSGFLGKTLVRTNCTLRITNEFNLGPNPASFTADQLLLDGGILQVTNSVALDDSNRGLTISTLGGKFDVSADATLTLPNPIVGGGPLTKLNTGTLILGGANAYTNGTTLSAGIINVQNSAGLGTNGTVSCVTRNGGIQLQGGVSIPATVNFTLSNDGTGAAPQIPYALDNVSGNNTVNGTITLTTGGGGAAIQSDSGALVLAGTIRIASGQSSRGITLQGASTAANTISGMISNLSATAVNSVTKNGVGTWTLTGTNIYTGPTTINGGTLVLSGNGSISNTALLSIAAGATFDVSGLSYPFVLGAGQSLSNSAGTLNGSLATTAGASIYPAMVGVAGTLTVTGNLNLGAGGIATFDLDSSTAGFNDLIVVGGNLTLSSSDYIHINATSGFLDATDYVLFSVGTGTTMASTPVLVWDGFIPGNYLNYSLLKVGNNVVLHYSSAVAPSVTASVTPNPATRNQAVTVSASVTQGSSSIASVAVDLTQIGGSATAALVLDSVDSTPPTYIYTNTFMVSAGTSLGDKALTVTATDNSSPTALTGTFVINPATITPNTVVWDGGAADNKWSSNANWTSDIGPGLIGDSVTLAGTVQPSSDLNANYSVTSLTFDGSAGAFTLASSTGSTLTSGSGGIANYSASAQTLNVPLVVSAAQTLNAVAGDLMLNANVTLGGNTLTVDGAAKTTIGGVISGTAGVAKNGPGSLVLPVANNYGNNGAADTALNAGTLVIGNDSALGSSRLNMADGVTIQSADSSTHIITNKLNFGSGAGGNNIFAGTGNLVFTGSAGNSSSKVLTVNNPQTEFSGVLSGAMARTVAGTGILVFSGANTYSQGTTINPGARLQLGNGGTNGSLSTSGVIDDEGTLIFNRSDALVQGTHFSTAPIVGAGGVVQAGAGTTTLNAANTYTGPTMINNGELFITTSFQGGGDVTVANGAKLGISANSMSNSATIGNLTVGSGGATTLDISYGFAGNPTNAALSATGVTISGASTIRIAGSFTVGSFPLLKYSSLSGAFVGTVVGPRGVTATVVNDTANQVIKVVVSAVGSGIVWTGTNSIAPNLWDLNTTTNWLIGGSPTIYLETVPPGDAVAFTDSGSGTVLVSNTVSPASVTLNNASTAYTFSGSGQVNAPGGLTKVGAAPVTLSVPGSYAGSTVLSNGTVNLGASQTFGNLSGNSVVTASAGTPTLTVNESLNTTFAGSVAGALTLTKTGTGGLTLPGSNSFTGNLFVKAGVLTLDSGFMNANNFCSIGQNGSDSGSLTLKGTATFNAANDFNVGDVGASVGTLNIQDGASLTVNSFFIGSGNAAGSTASGTVNQTGGTVTELNTGNGTFCIGGRVDSTSISAVGVYNLSGGTLLAGAGIRVGSAGTGTLNQSGGLIIATNGINVARVAGSVGTYNFDGGTLKTTSVGSSTAVNAIFNFNGGVLMPLGDSTSFVTNMTQANVRNGGVVVDTAGFNVTLGQALAHSTLAGDNDIDGGLTKRGNGTLTVAELGSYYTGPTRVLGGTLNLAPASVYNLSSLTVSNAALGLGLNGGGAAYYPVALTLMGNSALNLNYGFMTGQPVTAINISGSFTASGTTTLNVFGYGWITGQFPLVHYSGAPLPNLNNFALGVLPYGVTATLVNNTANSSIDLLVSSVSLATWIPLVGTDPSGTSSFAAGNLWQDANPPTPGKGYLTTAFALRSPADNSAYTFAGSALSIDSGGRFIMKGTNGQVMTVNNLVMNGGLVDYANAGDNSTETLGGSILLQGGLTSFMGALGSAGASETLFVTAPISGTGNLQLAGAGVNGGQDNGVVVLAGTNTYTGTTTVAGGTLLVSGANGNSAITVTTGAALGGAGSIAGPVTVQSGGTLAPGTPTRGALTAALGTLSLSGGATVSGNVSMKIDHAATPASDRVIGPSVLINPGATLVVNNLGSTNLVAGDTFALFSAPVSGAFTTVTLPALPSPSLYWTNRLAVNGTIAVATTVTVNPNPAPVGLSVSGNTLTLSWPADHLGWHLQVQTNAAGAGLSTNWATIPGSDTVTSTNLTINPAAGSVFYRMVYP